MSPAEYLACKRELIAKGKSEADAKRICAIAYYKRTGKRPQDVAHDEFTSWLALPITEEYIPPKMTDFEVITEEEGAALNSDVLLRFRGTALLDGVISQRGRGRLYTKAFNDKTLEATNAKIANGDVTTVFARHGKAIQPNALAEGIPCGKITKFYRDGSKIKYEGIVINTADGRDVAVGIRTESLKPTSVRFHHASFRRVKVNEEHVDEMIEGEINGVDFAEEAGIDGAGFEAVIEEATIVPITEGTMKEWKDLTLQEIMDNRKDLLEEYAASVLEAGAPDEVKALTTERDTLQASLAAAQEQLATAQEVIAERDVSIVTYEASMIGVGRKIFEGLKAKGVKTAADAAGALPEIRAKALSEFSVKRSGGQVEGAKGTTVDPKAADQKPGEVAPLPAQLTEEQLAQQHLLE